MNHFYSSFSFKLFFTSLFILFVNFLQAQMITTIAGGSIGDGKPATSVGMTLFYHEPTLEAIAVDAAENVYYIDNNVNRVRKISAATGILSTIAGNGTTLTGVGKPATEVGLPYIYSIALDKQGNIYLGSAGRISKIDATTGIITTIAGLGGIGYGGNGGLATRAVLSYPYSITVDATGNIYFTDQGAMIRKIAAGTGIISTIAGSTTQGYSGDGGPATQAKLSSPQSLATDTAGNIYVHDNNNRVIRKITAATGIITTYVGTGTYGSGGDGGQATAAEIAYPCQIVTDTAGNLYFGDLNRIRKVDAATGIINTIAGTGSAAFTPDGANATQASFVNIGDLAITPAGNIYFREENSALIRKIAANTNILTTVCGNSTKGTSNIGGPVANAQLYISYITVDRNNNIYLADFYNYKVHKIDAATNTISTVAGTGTEGRFLGEGQQATVTNISPSDMAVDSLGNFYFSEQGKAVRKVSVATGILSTVAGMGSPTSGSINSAVGLAFDKAGNLYIADAYSHVIRKVTATTGAVTTIAGSGTRGYSGDGGPATAASLNTPFQIAIDRAGNLYFSEYLNHIVRRVDAVTNIITTVAGTGAYGYNGDSIPATAALLNYPNGLATDTAGNIYIADESNNRIRKVTISTGKISTVAGLSYGGYNGDSILASTAALYKPESIAMDTSGNLIIADHTFRIRKIDFKAMPPATTPDPNPNPNPNPNPVPDSTDSIPPVVVSKVYPNPATQGSVTIALKGPISGKVSATVTDIYGKIITIEQEVLQPTTNYNLTVTLPPLKQGLYYVKVLINNERQTHILMIQ